MNRLAAPLFLVSLVSAPLGAQANGQPAERNAATHPAYTEEQAARGDTVFKKNCASCHDQNYHTGTEFRANWFGRNVWSLFTVLKKTMPDDNIGGLTDDEYTRVIAYILKMNGFPAGADSLRADSLAMSPIKIGPIATDSTKPPSRRR